MSFNGNIKLKFYFHQLEVIKMTSMLLAGFPGMCHKFNYIHIHTIRSLFFFGLFLRRQEIYKVLEYALAETLGGQ